MRLFITLSKKSLCVILAGLIIAVHYPFVCVRAATAFAGNCGAGL